MDLYEGATEGESPGLRDKYIVQELGGKKLDE